MTAQARHVIFTSPGWVSLPFLKALLCTGKKHAQSSIWMAVDALVKCGAVEKQSRRQEDRGGIVTWYRKAQPRR